MRITPLITSSVAVLFILLFKVHAQPIPVANHGFETTNLFSIPGWITSNHSGGSASTSSNVRSGSSAYANTTNTQTTSGYVQNDNSVAVAAGKYLVLIGHYQVASNASTSRVEIGIAGNMGSPLTPASSATIYQVSRAIQNTTGSLQNWNPRINMYLSNYSLFGRAFTWDDIIAYVSDNATVDLTKPAAPTNVKVNYSASSAVLSWTNGTDNTNGSGITRTLVMRKAGACESGPLLTDQRVYSATGGYGVSSEGSWVVIDTVNAGTTTYTDAGFTTSTTYTYALVHEDKAYNHSIAGLTYAPVAPQVLPAAPANNATGVAYLPALTLSWAATCGSANYDVYLSTTQADVDNQLAASLVSTAQTATSYIPAIAFNANATYYWKVVPKNSFGNPASGCPTWKFSTYTPSLSYQLSRATNTSFSSIISSGNNFGWSGTYNADDMMSDVLDLTAIGFTGFRYQDRIITSLVANTNGFISFNTTSAASFTNTFSAQPLIVAPFWEDLVCQGYLNTSQAQTTQLNLLKNSVRYLVTGPQGNQVLTIEWNEMEIYNNAGPSINFQLKLHEQDDRIEFVYGKMFGFNGTADYTYSYSSGISGFTVASTPATGQLISQQLANVLNFSVNNKTDLSELPDCYSTISLTPNTSPSATTETARSISNNECSGAIALSIQHGIQNDFCKVYSTKAATASANIPVCTASVAGIADDDVWFKFTTTESGNYAITVNGSGGFDPVVQLFSGNCSSLTPVACVNATGKGLIETITANNLVEATYFVRVYDGNTGSGGSGNFVVSVYNIITPPSNDDCNGAIALTMGVPAASGNTANATASASIPVCGATVHGTPDDDVWFKFTAISSITRLVANGGSAYNVVMQYFTGGCENLSSTGCVSSTGAAGIESADGNTTNGTTYYVRVYHSANGATPASGFTILAENGVPLCPALSSPANGVTNVSTLTTTSISWTAVTSPASGTKTYTVQVATDPSFNNLVALDNATGITGTGYTIAANKLSAATMYYWRVLCSNANGTSQGCGYYTMATTGVLAPPSCASNLTPLSGSTNLNTSQTLSWVAGSGSPSWYDVYVSTSQAQVSSLNSAAKVSALQTAITYNATGLLNNTTYYWTVIPGSLLGAPSACFVNSFTTIPAAPSNNNCGGAIVLNATSQTAVSGTVLNATQSLGASVGSAEDDVWYSFVAASTMHNISVESSSGFNAVVEVFSGSCGALTSLSCKNENGIGLKENLSASGLTIGETYYIRVYDFYATAPSTPTFTIRINDVDVGVSAFVSPASNSCGQTTVTVAIRNYSMATIDFALNPVTVAASSVSPANVTTTFSNVLVNSGTLASGQTKNITVTGTYHVISSGTYQYSAAVSSDNDNNTNNNSLTASLQNITLPAPFILSGTGSYCAGGTGVAFTLSGSETGTSYQIFKELTPVSGVINGTGSALSFTNVTDGGMYRMVATNTTTNCRSYMSAAATVTVNPLWLGHTSDWNTASNWCGNVVPATNANIVISGSAVHMPVLPSNITVHNLELTESNKWLALDGRTLTVTGKLSGAGVIKGGEGSSLVINGSGNMGLLKMNQDTPGITNKLKNLTINIGSNKISDSVVLGNKIQVTGTVTLSNGMLNANGNLVLFSDSNGTARIGAISSTADITGNVISQRYIPAITRRSRMLSPNTAGFTCEGFKDDLFITGPGPAGNGFDASSHSQSNTIYTYQETTEGGRGWKAIPNVKTGIAAGQGALVFVRGDRSLPAPQWYTAPYVPQNQVTVDYEGPVNKGNISPAITYTHTNDTSNDGWNLVGNPYPSQISWPMITRTHLNNFAYILDPATNGYVYNDGSTPLASGQAFFVQANAANPSITFTESCKVSAAPTNLFKTNPLPKLIIKMVKDAFNSDIAWLHFSPGASFSYDPMEDALKFTNASINMGFKVPANNNVQLNTIPELSTNTADTFVVFTTAPNGNYTLNVSQFGGIPASKSVWLRDLFLNTSSNLRVDSVYPFTISSVAGSKGERFQLIITDAGALPVQLVSIAANALNEKDVEVTWSTANEKNNKGFVVERASSNGTWSEVTFVKGKGNSNTLVHYSITHRDAFISDDVLYYRIRQFDFSGASQVSNVVKVMREQLHTAKLNELNVYPNPATGIVHIEQEKELGEISIIDITGKTVLRQTEPGYKTSIDISALQAGVYFISSSTGAKKKLLIN